MTIAVAIVLQKQQHCDVITTTCLYAIECKDENSGIGIAVMRVRDKFPDWGIIGVTSIGIDNPACSTQNTENKK
jgi:hypothetical protein